MCLLRSKRGSGLEMTQFFNNKQESIEGQVLKYNKSYIIFAAGSMRPGHYGKIKKIDLDYFTEE